MEIILREQTIKNIIDMLTECSRYIELGEDLGINNEYEELRKIRACINYYDIDDMIEYLCGKIGDNK